MPSLWCLHPIGTGLAAIACGHSAVGGVKVLRGRESSGGGSDAPGNGPTAGEVLQAGMQAARLPLCSTHACSGLLCVEVQGSLPQHPLHKQRHKRRGNLNARRINKLDDWVIVGLSPPIMLHKPRRELKCQEN